MELGAQGWNINLWPYQARISQELVRDWMKTNEITQTALAEMSGVKQNTISDWLSGKASKTEITAKIIKALESQGMSRKEVRSPI